MISLKRKNPDTIYKIFPLCKSRQIRGHLVLGGWGHDFSMGDTEEALRVVSKELLAHGVTSYCPTVVTSPPSIYHKVLPLIKKRKGGKHGAAILGAHVEGPFINKEKKGAHPPQHIIPFDKGIDSLEEVYGSLENVRIVTLAPEHEKSDEVIKNLVKKGVVVSLGTDLTKLYTV